jgi:acetamidase/formamidase
VTVLAEHLIRSTPQNISWGTWDGSRQPVLAIESGDTVTIETLSGERKDIPPADSKFQLLPDHIEFLEKGKPSGLGPHLLTGPVFIRDAQPGDVLKVEIKEVRLRQNWGWNLQLPSQGTLPDDFPEPRRIHVPIDPRSGAIELPWGQTFVARPFFGNFGVAPPVTDGKLSSIEPRPFGGNMDNKELRPGAFVYFPVFVEGALFSAGDGHALQGDGEVCLTAIETALTGTFKFTVEKKRQLRWPRASTQSSWITMGFHESLDQATKIALREMIALIGELTGLSAQDAYTLCSIASDLHITQTVNRHKGVHCTIDKKDLPNRRP